MTMEASWDIADALATALDGKAIEPAILPLFSALYSACAYVGKDPYLEFCRLLTKLDGATHRTTSLN